MARMKPPIVPEQAIPIIPADGLRRLLTACAGNGFEARQPGGSRTTCRAPRASPSLGLAPPQRPAGNPPTTRVDHRRRPAPTDLARGAEPTGTDWTLEEAMDG
jgi:hypothetical protein